MSFESMYAGTPPWDDGRPQREFVRLELAGEIGGNVLDVGCGTGENALYLAARGHEVVGVDAAPTAIAKAKAKAKARDVAATFRVHDALKLKTLRQTFDTVIDSGLFHTFPDEERQGFAKSLGGVLSREGRYLMMCFSEREPGTWGPRRVTQAEIRGTFRDALRVDWIRAGRFEAHMEGGGNYARAWVTKITRGGRFGHPPAEA